MISGQFFDVVVVTDARLVGGGNKSLAQEITAQAAAGYKTGLLSLSGPARGGGRPIDSSLQELIKAGMLSMIRPDQDTEANLVIARGPSMFEVAQPFRPRLRARHWLLVANAFNTSREVSGMLYDPLEVENRAAELFGHQWTWIPLSTVVRQNMLRSYPKLNLSSDTWSNIINTSDWWIDRPESLNRPIRLGRHSRDAPGKWPTSKTELLNAYPSDPAFEISVMGGARTPTKILGTLPTNWKVLPFGAKTPKDFLRNVDIYPYFHHPLLKEAFGRAVLEAVATGAVAILPHYFEPIFYEAAIYADSSEVSDIAGRLAESPVYLKERRNAAKNLLEERFSFRSHTERLSNLIGPPRRTVVATERPAPILRDLAQTESGKTPVLFYTDNGHGLGHVSRLMAYAKRLSSSYQPYFLTMSEAYHLVHEQGFPVEYFPSAKKMGFSAKRKPDWEEIFYLRMTMMLDRLKPAAVVVDHVNPPEIMRLIKREYPAIRFVWSRRGLWRQHRKPAGLRMADAFDYVIEPMDLAAAVDMGFTTRQSEGTVYVPPVSLVQKDELISRREARTALGLPETGTVVLLNLSADSTDQLVSLILHIKALLLKYAGNDESLTIFAPRHALHSTELGQIAGVVMKPVYPVALYAQAFDAAISTAGYNSYHELVHLGVPSVFVARATQTLDDQNRRASFAPIAGFGRSAQQVDSLEFEEALQAILDPHQRSRMRAAALEASPINGANTAAAAIELIAMNENPESLDTPAQVAVVAPAELLSSNRDEETHQGGCSLDQLGSPATTTERSVRWDQNDPVSQAEPKSETANDGSDEAGGQ